MTDTGRTLPRDHAKVCRWIKGQQVEYDEEACVRCRQMGEGRTPSPDPRDPHPCPTCGLALVYDGWDSVHTEGPQRNYGADNCRFVVTGILPNGRKP